MHNLKLRITIGVALAALIGLSWAFAAPTNTVYIPRVDVLEPTVQPSDQNPLRSGQATYYFGADGSGNCAFAPIPGDLMVAAISHVDYSDPLPAAYCGAYAEVYGPSGTVTVRIVDKCPDAGCAAGHLDLSPEAFDLIAERSQGRVAITWRIVSPSLSGPIAYHFKDGSHQWWTAVQIRNHRNPIAKLEYKNSQGQWVNVERVDYNYFVEPSGMGPGPYSFRVTDSYGNVLLDNGIVGGDNIARNGAAQFPVGPTATYNTPLTPIRRPSNTPRLCYGRARKAMPYTSETT